MFEFDASNVRLGVVLVADVTDSVEADADPSVGVTSVGDVDNTLLPDPVEVVTPVPPLATLSVPPSVSVPDVVIGPPVRVRPVVPPDPLTLVTEPPLMMVAHVPSPRQYVVDDAPVPLFKFVTGRLPVICDVGTVSVPPSEILPAVVTVPVRVRPLTVPAPLTLVTVPDELMAAPICAMVARLDVPACTTSICSAPVSEVTWGKLGIVVLAMITPQ